MNKKLFKTFAVTFALTLALSLGFCGSAFADTKTLAIASGDEFWGWIVVGVGGIVLLGTLFSILIVLIIYGLFKLLFGSKSRNQKKREEEHRQYLADKAKKEEKKNKKLAKKGILPEPQANVDEVKQPLYAAAPAVANGANAAKPQAYASATAVKPVAQNDPNKLFIPLVTEPVEDLPVLDMCALDDSLNEPSKKETVNEQPKTVVDGLAVPELPPITEAPFVVKKAETAAEAEPVTQQTPEIIADEPQIEAEQQKAAESKDDLFAPIDINSVLDEPILPLDPKDAPLGSEGELLPVFSLPDEELLDTASPNGNDVLLSVEQTSDAILTVDADAATDDIIAPASISAPEIAGNAVEEFEIIPPSLDETSPTEASELTPAAKDIINTEETAVVETSEKAAIEPIETVIEKTAAPVEEDKIAVEVSEAKEVKKTAKKPTVKKTAADKALDKATDINTETEAVAPITEAKEDKKKEAKPTAATPKKDAYNIPLDALKPKNTAPAQKATSIEEALAFLNVNPNNRS